MAGKKKKGNANGEQQDNVAVQQTTDLAVQPPNAEVPAPARAPARARPRKKNKKNSMSNEMLAFIAWPSFGDEDEPISPSIAAWLKSGTEDDAATPKVDKKASTGSKEPRPAGSKKGQRRVRFEGLEDDNPGEPEVDGENHDNEDDAAAAPEEEHEDASVKDAEKSTKKYTNPKRKAALEEVRRFKAAILVKVETWTFPNDTPFTPSPYPVDLYLCAQPSNTPDDNAMLDLKRAFDAAITEHDPSLLPPTTSIPLALAKRAARYVRGLLRAHDSQFRFAIDGLRAPVDNVSDEPPASWVADIWDERLSDSDRDWLLGQDIEAMEDEKAQGHVGAMLEFVFKYKAWGKLVEEECAEVGVQLFPRLN